MGAFCSRVSVIAVAIAALLTAASVGPEPGVAAGNADPPDSMGRYTLVITVRMERAEYAVLPGGERSMDVEQVTIWTARTQRPFEILSTGKGKARTFRFTATVIGELANHKGGGWALIRGTKEDCFARVTDAAPSGVQRFRGTLRFDGTRKKLASGKTVDVMRVVFTRKQPLEEPRVTETWAAPECDPPVAMEVKERHALPVPPSWRLSRPTSLFSRLRTATTAYRPRAFNWSFGSIAKRGELPREVVEVPGGGMTTAMSWTIRFDSTD